MAWKARGFVVDLTRVSLDVKYHVGQQRAREYGTTRRASGCVE